MEYTKQEQYAIEEVVRRLKDAVELQKKIKGYYFYEDE
jgi:hypothetical protein